MEVHYLRISDDGKNLQLSITNNEQGVDITKFLIRTSINPEYIDISDEIANADTFIDTDNKTKYVFNILLESIGITSDLLMFYIHLEDENSEEYYGLVGYYYPVYFTLFTFLSTLDEKLSFNNFIFVNRLYLCLEGIKMAIEMDRFEEAEFLYNQLVVLNDQSNTRFLELDNYPIEGE